MIKSNMKTRQNRNDSNRKETSRTDILLAGIDAFGRLGFAGATTRMIAEEAGANLGLLQYYFGGKEKLYVACAEHIVAHMEPGIIALSTVAQSTVTSDSASLEDHLESLSTLWMAACDLLLGSQGPKNWLTFVSREQLSPGPAANIFYQRIVKRLIDMFSRPIGTILDLSPKTEEVILNTLAILGPIFIFQRAPGIVLTALGWPQLDGERMKRAKKILARQSIYGLDVRTGSKPKHSSQKQATRC